MKTFLNNLTLREAVMLFGGKAYINKANPDTRLSYICTDSREVEERALFVALVGENTDGHKYIDNAVRDGACLIVCERLPERTEDTCAYILVENSEKALAYAAHEYRKKYCPSLSSVAVTGSVGKTTAKEIIFAALSSSLEVYKTDGNFNSVIGMPISLLSMRRDYKYAVYEMGMSALGEISLMSNTLNPKIGVITNIGHSHLEYLKTRENILKAKLEITEGLDKDGFLVINADDEMLSQVDFSAYPFKTVRCSLTDENADYYAYNIRFTDKNSMLFDFKADGENYKDAEISGVGNHLVTTSLCAISAAKILGVNTEDAVKGISNFKNASMRQNIQSVAGFTLIEDCYNAAPESMRSALDALSRLKSKNAGAKAVAILGDMKELGEESALYHAKIGEYAAKSSVDILITIGALAKNMVKDAENNGISKENIYSFESLDDISTLADIIDERLHKGDIILVKASRSMRAERAVEYIKSLENN